LPTSGPPSKGLPWRGLVKNRCKNGDFYWVDAFVVPIKSDGRIIGYQSVRTPAQSNRRAAAEAAYRAAGQTGSLPSTGRAACRWPPAVGFDCRHPGADAAGRRDRPAWRQRKQCSLQTLYQDKQIPSNLANKMMFLLPTPVADHARAAARPANPSAKLHDHPLDLHVENTLKNRGEINAALDELKAQAERAGAGAVRQVQRHPQRYSSEGINVARGLLKDGRYQQANELLLLKINPLYAEMKRDGEA
jgi:hypothetical protein